MPGAGLRVRCSIFWCARWDADCVRDDLRDYVIEHLGAAGAVLVVERPAT
jgi:hypothetical protein